MWWPLTHRVVKTVSRLAALRYCHVKHNYSKNMVWKRDFVQEENSYQQKHITMLFTAVENPDRFLQSRKFAIETSCHKTAEKQMCTLACNNSPAPQLLQELKVWRRPGGLMDCRAAASPWGDGEFSSAPSCRGSCKRSLPGSSWSSLNTSELLGSSVLSLAQLQWTNTSQHINGRSAARGDFLPLYNSHHVTTTVTWGK